MSPDLTHVKGTVIPGYGVASGKGKDDRYPEGTIKAQIPHFKELGLDLSGFYPGTMNIDISPSSYEIATPLHFFKQVHWTDHIPPENFLFFNVEVLYKTMRYSGYIYMPDHKTKVEHNQKSNVLELILPKIEGISYGDQVELIVDNKQIMVLG